MCLDRAGVVAGGHVHVVRQLLDLCQLLTIAVDHLLTCG